MSTLLFFAFLFKKWSNSSGWRQVICNFVYLLTALVLVAAQLCSGCGDWGSPLVAVTGFSSRQLLLLQSTGSWAQAPGHRLLRTGSRAQAPGHRLQGTGSRAQAPELRAQALGHRLPGTGSVVVAPGLSCSMTWGFPRSGTRPCCVGGRILHHEVTREASTLPFSVRSGQLLLVLRVPPSLSSTPQFSDPPQAALLRQPPQTSVLDSGPQHSLPLALFSFAPQPEAPALGFRGSWSPPSQCWGLHPALLCLLFGAWIAAWRPDALWTLTLCVNEEPPKSWQKESKRMPEVWVANSLSREQMSDTNIFVLASPLGLARPRSWECSIHWLFNKRSVCLQKRIYFFQTH